MKKSWTLTDNSVAMELSLHESVRSVVKEKGCKLSRAFDQTRLFVNYKYHGEMKSSLLEGKTKDSKIDEIIRYLTGTGKLYLRKDEVTGEIRVDHDPAMKKYAL